MDVMVWTGKRCVARTVAEQSIEMGLWESIQFDRYKTAIKSGKFEHFIDRIWQELERNFYAKRIYVC